jgi:steroid delta-isomerase-like uncharacterized protein
MVQVGHAVLPVVIGWEIHPFGEVRTMAQTGKAMQQEVKTPEQVAVALFDAIAARDLDRPLDLQHPDAVDDFVAIGQFRGREGIRGLFSELYEAFPDFRIEVERIVADDHTAVVQWEASGTFSGGPFQGIDPTGKPVSIRGVDVMEIEGGKLHHNTIYYDGAAFARQIGMLPRAGSIADRAVLSGFNAVTRLRSRLRGSE